VATVTWRTGESPAPLWPQILPTTRRERVVVYVAGRDRLVVETAQSLLDWLNRQQLAERVEVLDLSGDRSPWGGNALVDLNTAPLRIDAARLRAGATVPALWLEDFLLVAVCAAAPDPQSGLSAVLAAQARLLGGGVARTCDLFYEAHRLLAADVSVACGSLRFGERGSGTWWAGSDSDVALEAAIARAAGGAPERLLQLRHLAQREPLDLRVSEGGRAPSLQGYLAPAWRTWLGRAGAEGGYVVRTAVEDLRAAASNLRRTRSFLERRLGNGGEG
jgi:hypothetical protein